MKIGIEPISSNSRLDILPLDYPIIHMLALNGLCFESIVIGLRNIYIVIRRRWTGVVFIRNRVASFICTPLIRIHDCLVHCAKYFILIRQTISNYFSHHLIFSFNNMLNRRREWSRWRKIALTLSYIYRSECQHQ
jgi:hypothetical protein